MLSVCAGEGFAAATATAKIARRFCAVGVVVPTDTGHVDPAVARLAVLYQQHLTHSIKEFDATTEKAVIPATPTA